MHLEAAFDALPRAIRTSRPVGALILGSGWSDGLTDVEIIAECHYEQIPGLGRGDVVGHENCLRLCQTRGLTVLAFCGRRHWYECADWQPVILPVAIAQRLGTGFVLATNAAGAIRPDLSVGDLMSIQDHLNLTGLSPLQSASRPDWCPQFPDLTAVYDADLGAGLQREALALDLRLSSGVYAFTPGPCYETPAEIRALAKLGAHAVGMSTVPECILAHTAGMRVAAVSCITNMAAGILKQPLSHDDVLESVRRAAPDMSKLLRAFLAAIAGITTARHATPDPADHAVHPSAG